MNSTHNHDGNYGNPKLWVRDLKSPKRGMTVLTTTYTNSYNYILLHSLEIVTSSYS